MFRFTQPEDGAEERYEHRVELHQKTDVPLRRHHFWWFIHNCLAHPCIGLMPFFSWTFKFHDWTSKKINLQE